MNRRNFLKLGSGVVGLLAAMNWPRVGRASGINYEATGVDIINYPPANDGFSFPAEWTPHERTLMQFPPAQNWEDRQLNGARKDWAAVANAVAEFEPVTMAVQPKDKKVAKELLSSSVDFVEFQMNDAWSRDSGPMILTNDAGERRVAGFEFNGWGGKFPPFDDDALAKARFAKHLGISLHPADMVLEGGAVAVDGEGTLLTTEECLLNKNRNPGKSKAEIETILKGWLGVEKIIWLPKGLTPDPITDGHIDGMAAFAAPGVLLLHMTKYRDDPNLLITYEARKVLEEVRDAKGRKLEIIEIPLTSWDVVHMNFYICNGGVIVPVAGKDLEDDGPLAIIREAFPKHEIVPITGRYLAGGGGIHCITQQVPAV